jgi:hypothetical protein
MLIASIFALFAARPEGLDQWIFSLLLLTVLAIHAVREGVHWQLVPLYSTVPALLIGWLPYTPVAALPWIGIACLLLIALSITASVLVPIFKLPAPSGPYRVGTRILYMVDASRDASGGTLAASVRELASRRELMVQLWYPAEPARNRKAVYRRLRETTPKSSHHAVLRTDSFLNAPISSQDAPHPLLLFSPAWTGQRTQSTFQMQDLASHGFVVASIDHTYYSGRVAFPDGRVLDGQFAPQLGNFENVTVPEAIELIGKYVLIEAKDQVFVLDQLSALNHDETSSFYQQLDLTRIGAFGHSIGGAAACEACYLDSRIKAALNIDGWMGADVLTEGLAKPWMAIYGRETENRPSSEELNAGAPVVQRYWEMNKQNDASVEASLMRFGGFRLYIEGAGHWNFSDRPLYSPRRSWTSAGPIPPRRAFEIINSYTRAFFSQALNGKNEPLLQQSRSEFSDVEFEVWPPPAEGPSIVGVSAGTAN